MNGRRTGRIDLAWLLAAGFAGALLVVVLLGRLPERDRSEPAEEQRGGVQPHPTELAALADAIDKLDQRLARIEAALAVQASRGEREPVKPTAATEGQHASDDTGPGGLNELHQDMQMLSKRIDGLAASLKDGYKPAFEMPTLEQFQAARRDIDWAFVEDLRQRWRSDPSVALERVRGMTFDELLKKVGLPTEFAPGAGAWGYYRPYRNADGEARSRGVVFYFAGDRVIRLGGTED